MIDKEKVYKDIREFIYKYTHEAALTYPVPDDYISLAKNMKFVKTVLRLDFPQGMQIKSGKISRIIYDSGQEAGEEIAFEYTVGMGGKVEVAYCLEKDVILSAEEKDLYQWVCDQIFLVYGKQQVVDALNLISKVRKG